MVKLIISDLDGTLLCGTQQVSEEMFELIREMKKKGIIFAVASGRQYQSLKKQFLPVWEDMAFISENGAVVFYKDQMIAQKTVPMETLLKMVSMIDADEQTDVALSSATTTYIRPKRKDYVQSLLDMGNHVCQVKEWAEVTEPCVKLAWFEENGAQQRQEYWQSRIEPPAKVVTSGAMWLDVLYPDTHKGTGVAVLEEYFGVSREETAAFGDNDNDREMLEIVGYPFAMTSGKESILKLCPYSTSRVEDTIRQILDGEFPK